MAEGETWINALIGAVVGVVLSMLPFSTVIGGAVAGYLHGGGREAGIRVGALAGGIMLVPILLFLLVVGNLFLFASVGGMGPGGMFGAAGGLTIVAFIFALFFGLVYIVGFAALGGYIGNYVKHDTDIGG